MRSIRHAWLVRLGFAVVAAVGLAVAALPQAAVGPPGRELRLAYRSPVDGTDQPYRLYVPSTHDGKTPLPVVIFLHGTSGNEGTLFDDPRYGSGAARSLADKYQVLLVSPFGRGAYEYRDIAENDFFCVLEDVRTRYPIDPDRIYLTGHSMGGSGTAYLALGYPDLFAAAAPLSAAISYPWLAANARYVPFWWMCGADERPKYRAALAVCFGRMSRLGSASRAEVLAGEGHFGPVKELDRIFGWLVSKRRVAHPTEYVFEVDTPLHGRAYWTSVDTLDRPGKRATLRARAASRLRAELDTENVSEFTFVPDPQVFDLSGPLEVRVDQAVVFSARLEAASELRIRGGPARWAAAVEPRRRILPTAWRTHPVARAPEAVAMGGTESRLGNWITDAMRAAVGADVALYLAPLQGGGFRSTPLPAGTVDIGDLIACSRPWDMPLETVQLGGRDLLEVLEANLSEPGPARGQPDNVVQISGARYRFDRRHTPGRRIVWSDIDPHRSYRVVLEGQTMEEESLRLGGRFGRLAHHTEEVSFLMALYGHAARSGVIAPRLEGRVVDAASR